VSYTIYIYSGIKRPERGVNHKSPSSAEVKARVELYFYSPLWDFMACSGTIFTFIFLLWSSDYNVKRVSEYHRISKRIFTLKSTLIGLMKIRKAASCRTPVIYKVVQIWPGQTLTCLHTNSPGHIWTTLYIKTAKMSQVTVVLHPFKPSVFFKCSHVEKIHGDKQ
jgi:hypothetical protein